MKKLFIIASLCLMFGAALMPAQTVSAQEITEEPVVKTGHITDPEFQDIAWEMMGDIVNSRIALYSFDYPIDWTVKAKSLKTTAYFNKSKGSFIAIDITTSATAWGGIIDYDGKVTYVEGKKLKTTFLIEKSNYYCVFVQNNNSTKITAKGTYTK